MKRGVFAALLGAFCASGAFGRGSTETASTAIERPKLSPRLGRAVEVYPSPRQVEGRCFLVLDPAEQMGRVFVVDAESGAIERSIVVGGDGEWIRVVGDADGDGLRDLVVGTTCSRQGAACFSFRDGTYRFALATQHPVAELGRDVDADGCGDLVVLGKQEVIIASGRDGHALRSADVSMHGTPRLCAVDAPRLGEPAILVACGRISSEPDPYARILVLSAALEIEHVVVDPRKDGRVGAGGSRFGKALCVLPTTRGEAWGVWFVGSPYDVTASRLEGAQRDRVYRLEGADRRPAVAYSDSGGKVGAALALAPDTDADERPDLLVGDPDFGGQQGQVVLLSSRDGSVLRRFGPYENPQPKSGRDESELRTSSSMACNLGDESQRAILVVGCSPLSRETRAAVRGVDVRTGEVLWTLLED